MSSASAHTTAEEVKRKYWTPAIDQSHAPGAWGVIAVAYSESHRAYHGWDHINDLLEKLDRFSSLAARPDLIATAIFWHDAVYKTQNADGSYRPDIDNVRASADLFRTYTRLPPSDADAVYDMIMATGQHMKAKAETIYYEGFEGDLNLFLDLDLSSLGATWEVFASNTDKIQSEYSWVDNAVFCKERAAILRGFALEGVRLFRRDETNHEWGAPARSNLVRSVTELEKKAATPQ